MSPIVPLTQEPHALIETSTSDEQAYIHRATESAKFRTTSASFLESRMLRWIAAALMLALLAWMMLFSEKSSEPSNSLSTSSPEPLNGTELLVRAYKIPDPNTSGTGQRSFSGTLQARYQSLLGFRVAGKIVQRLVEVGDRVKKGQVLFKLDPTDYDLQLQVAQADLEAAKSQLVQIEAEERRLSDLRKTRSAS
ncbi:MAG: efflux RND transporter periplasmic adaptor subunit, partial [Planctomycetota bacterium]